MEALPNNINIEAAAAALREVYAEPWGLKADDRDAVNAVVKAVGRSATDADIEVVANRRWEDSGQTLNENLNGDVDEFEVDARLILHWLDEAEKTPLDESSPTLHAALSTAAGEAVGTDMVAVDALNTGGGCMVCAIDLSQDGRFMGRQVWLTREDPNEWLVGFYDFANDDDEGICVVVRGVTAAGRRSADNPEWVAGQVAGILRRLAVRLGP